MGLFTKKIGPVFLKEDSSAKEQLAKMEELCDRLIGDDKKSLEKECKRLDYGTKHFEGIYSPVTQNQHHLEKLKQIRLESKTNIIMRKAFEANFKNTYRSLVVLANPKTVLMDKTADKDIRDQVIRADQLVRYIKNDLASIKDYEWPEKEMRELAEYYLQKYNTERKDYTEKYAALTESVQPNNESETVLGDDDSLKEALKAYRLEKSREEGMKAYYVFKDETIDEIVAKRPATIEALFDIKGLGEKKIEKYGKDILEIIKKN